jgi:hypothetical protein
MDVIIYDIVSREIFEISIPSISTGLKRAMPRNLWVYLLRLLMNK